MEKITYSRWVGVYSVSAGYILKLLRISFLAGLNEKNPLWSQIWRILAWGWRSGCWRYAQVSLTVHWWCCSELNYLSLSATTKKCSTKLTNLACVPRSLSKIDVSIVPINKVHGEQTVSKRRPFNFRIGCTNLILKLARPFYMQHNLTSTAVVLISFQWLLNKNPLTFSTGIPCFFPIALSVSLPDSYVMISKEIKLTSIKRPSRHQDS